jgi:hypothetical protein
MDHTARKGVNFNSWLPVTAGVHQCSPVFVAMVMSITITLNNLSARQQPDRRAGEWAV